MNEFVKLLEEERVSVERFVRFRISLKADADDVLQEVFFTAYQKFSPKLGEKISWGMYDIPSRKCSHVYDMQVTGKATVHGIQGVELTAREAPYSDKNEVINRTFVAQLTDTHCRYLATLRNGGDVRNYITFLDGDEFLPNWGFGEDNCGNETNLVSKGDIIRTGATVTSSNKSFLLDIVGRYTVTIDGKSYDTVCVMDIETYNCGVVSEQFLDKNERTILWRRFNRDDWAIDHYQKSGASNCLRMIELPSTELPMFTGTTVSLIIFCKTADRTPKCPVVFPTYLITVIPAMARAF